MKKNICSYMGEVADFTEVNSTEYREWDKSCKEMTKKPEEAAYQPEMNQEVSETRHNVSLFCKVGIVVLSLVLIIGTAVYLIPKTIAANSSSMRKLPIYCVNTEQPKIALSFDAAWGKRADPVHS